MNSRTLVAIIVSGILLILVGSCASLMDRAYITNQPVSFYRKGETTATGERFDSRAFTCAVATKSMAGCWYRFESNGNVVYAYANDLIGPAGLEQGRRYELSEAAFKRLAPFVDTSKGGVVEATVTRAR